jgi:glycosyltransferase involved in cell wall biosynthesis
MKKICIDARMLHHSGIGVYLRNVIKGLIESNLYDITVLADKNYTALQGIKTIDFLQKIYSPSEQIYFPITIPTCDIFWSPHYNVPVLPIAAKKRLVTVHDVYHLAHQQELSAAQRVYAKIMFRAATHLSDHIITVSEFSKQEIIKYTHTKTNKITTIYNGVDIDFFAQKLPPTTQHHIIQHYQLPQKYVLFVGNVKPNKNLKNLIRAFALFSEKEPDFKLVILGKKNGFITGDEGVFELINAYPSLSEKIIFTGFVADSDLPTIYQLAAMLVFPSLYEGFGFPPLEAMSAGCPVVCSDRSSLPEVGGEAVFYCNPEDVNSIYLQMLECLANPKESQLLLKQAQQFSWKKSIDAHVAIINSLVE